MTDGSKGIQRMQEVRGLPLLTITASVPQLAYKKHSVRSITQDFSPQPLVHSHWRSFSSCILSPGSSSIPCPRGIAASFLSGEMLSHGHHPGPAEAEGMGFPFSLLNAVASNPERWSCPKFDHFILAHTAASKKQQLNQNCFLAPEDLDFLNDNMLPCEEVEKWSCQPCHEVFKKKETEGNRKQKLPPHLPHRFIALTLVIVTNPHYSQQKTQSLRGSFCSRGWSCRYGCISGCNLLQLLPHSFQRGVTNLAQDSVGNQHTREETPLILSQTTRGSPSSSWMQLVSRGWGHVFHWSSKMLC